MAAILDRVKPGRSLPANLAIAVTLLGRLAVEQQKACRTILPKSHYACPPDPTTMAAAAARDLVNWEK